MFKTPEQKKAEAIEELQQWAKQNCPGKPTASDTFFDQNHQYMQVQAFNSLFQNEAAKIQNQYYIDKANEPKINPVSFSTPLTPSLPSFSPSSSVFNSGSSSLFSNSSLGSHTDSFGSTFKPFKF